MKPWQLRSNFNGRNLTLATIYCSNGKPNIDLFSKINALSTDVMFLGDFNSKEMQFGLCPTKRIGSIPNKYS